MNRITTGEHHHNKPVLGTARTLLRKTSGVRQRGKMQDGLRCKNSSVIKLLSPTTLLFINSAVV